MLAELRAPRKAAKISILPAGPTQVPRNEVAPDTLVQPTSLSAGIASQSEGGPAAAALSTGADVVWALSVFGDQLPPETGPRTSGEIATKTPADFGGTVVIAASGFIGQPEGQNPGHILDRQGGGVFIWDQQGSTDDGGTFIVPRANVGVSGAGWRRIFTGSLDVSWFGALSLHAFYNHTVEVYRAVAEHNFRAFGNAIQAAATLAGQPPPAPTFGERSAVLSVPPGHYPVRPPHPCLPGIDFSAIDGRVKKLHLMGAGRGASVITYDGSEFAIRVRGYRLDLSVSSLAIHGYGEHGSGILLAGSGNFHLRDVNVVGFKDVGVKLGERTLNWTTPQERETNSLSSLAAYAMSISMPVKSACTQLSSTER
jgi:hypothetical protein